MAAGVRAEQHAARLQRRMQFVQHPRQRLAGDVEQRRIREYAVEVARRQVEREEVLLQHVAAAGGTRHRGKPWRTLQPGGGMPESRERVEVTARPATEIQNHQRRWRLDGLKQCRDVLAHVVIARTFRIGLRSLVVVRERARDDLVEAQASAGPLPSGLNAQGTRTGPCSALGPRTR
jgi:hypothetical protein